MPRTPEEILQHHAEALGAGNLDEIVADDAVFITPAGVRQGLDGIREAFTQLLADVPDAAPSTAADYRHAGWRISVDRLPSPPSGANILIATGSAM